MTHFFTSSLWRGALVLTMLLFMAPRLFSQCNPDVTPPTAVCLNGMSISIPPSGEFLLWGSDIVATFADDCCLGALQLKREVDGLCDSDNLPDAFGDSIKLCCADAGAGPFTVTLRAYDCAGNFSECSTAITVIPETTPPTAVCDNFTNVALTTGNTVSILAAAFDDGSYDNCCMGAFKVRKQSDGPCDSDSDPDGFGPEVIFCCAEIGAPIIVELQVNDCAGNATICLVTVNVEDKGIPTLQAPANTTVSCENFDPTFQSYGTPTVLDNCCIDTIVEIVNYNQFDTLCSTGTVTRTFVAYDCSGNSSTLGVASAVQTIVFTHQQHYFIKFPDDLLVGELSPTGYTGEPSFFGENCELLGVSYNDQVFTNEPDCDLKIERSWYVINWCTYDPNLPVTQVPNPSPNAMNNHPENLLGVIVSEAGTLAPWAPSVVKINATDPTATDYSTFWSANTNAYEYKQIVKVIDSFFVKVQGKVFSDSTINCSYDAGEALLADWTVRATGQVTGQTFDVLTNVNGEYSVTFGGLDTAVVITLVSSSNFGQDCQSEYTVHANVGETVVQDVPVHLEQRCGLLSVGISAARLRRCSESNQYTVQACNLSGQLVEDAFVEVSLDNYFNYISSTVSGTLVSGNTYKFQLGDLPSGDCQSFNILFGISCDAQLSATHCTEANIYPKSDCRDNANWSGADVEVNATCDGDSVRFAITNIGNGNMTELLDFVVVEDVVMRQEGNFQLNQGQTQTISFPANGSTWRLEAQEEPLHPFGGPEAAALEGCGGINTPGLVNLFPMNDPDPFQATDCQQNIGSFDPNDKQGFPSGYGSQHFIKANIDLEYLIRFQNTGTDTAFTVVVVDALAAHLDPASVRVEVASHPMEFALLEGGILRFTFDNILLPDSNVNQLGSNGFVKFRVSQKPGLVDGTVIENQAAIFFDGNDPIITNTTLHTIGDHFVTVSTDDLANDGLLRAYPNPASDIVYFDLKDQANAGRFELSNNLGQQVSVEQFSGNQFRFERKNLPAGIYHFQILANSTQIASGKIVLR